MSSYFADITLANQKLLSCNQQLQAAARCRDARAKGLHALEVAVMFSRIRFLSFCLAIVTIGVSVTEAQNYKVIYSFAGGTDGSGPEGWLITDANGNLYGTTSSGGVAPHCGSSLGCGTVFALSPSGQETVLHRFNGQSGGSHPHAGLLQDPQGNLLGTTSGGSGPSLGGNIFQLDPNTRKTTVLYGFSDGKDGGDIISGVIRDSHGNLYGTTAGGGKRQPSRCQLNGCGVVYKLDKNGKESVLHAFTGGSDGWSPAAGLVMDAADNLFGMTGAGGNLNCGNGTGCGTIFKIDGHGRLTTLHSFSDTPDGAGSGGALILDSEGNLYGTTIFGGAYGYGTVFKMDQSGNVTILRSFSGVPDGMNPVSGLVRDSGGTLYGTTYAGGDASCGFMGSGCGVVFRLDANGNYSLLYTFTGGADGGWPGWGSLFLDSAGNLYGLASGGGTQYQGHDNGVVFEITW